MTRKELKKEYKVKKKALKKKYKEDKEDLIKEYVVKINEEPKINMSKEAPYRGVLEEVGNAVSHGVGSIFAIVAFILMLLKCDKTIEYVASIIYFFGLFVLFTMSCLYHSFPYGSKVKKVFRRFDYSSIYLLIGATFAPLTLMYVGGTFGLVFCISQWVIIITGITMVCVFGPGRLKWLHFPLYLILGWSALIFLPQMIKNDLTMFLFILGGGIIYTLGLIPFTIDKKVSHFLWHIFVLLGAIVQWLGIYLFMFCR